MKQISCIGIPRALYFFHYHPLWKSYLEGLGFQVVFSPPTNKAILQWGLSQCVDGMCLPVKAYLGHANALVQRGVDQLFVPRIISVRYRQYTCPNFLGLADLLKEYLPERIKLICPVLDGRKGARALERSYWDFGLKYKDRGQVQRSWQAALGSQAAFDAGCLEQADPDGESKKLLFLGGPRYLTDDPFLNGNLKGLLRGLGNEVLTAANVGQKSSFSRRPPGKPLFWTEADRSLAALEHLLDRLAGVISIVPFGCGAQSLLSVLVERRVKTRPLPKLELHLDEHTGSLGMITRLEAFCDILKGKG